MKYFNAQDNRRANAVKFDRKRKLKPNVFLKYVLLVFFLMEEHTFSSGKKDFQKL